MAGVAGAARAPVAGAGTMGGLRRRGASCEATTGRAKFVTGHMIVSSYAAFIGWNESEAGRVKRA